MASGRGGAVEDGTITASQQKRSTLLTVCPFILGNEFCERLAFYGLSTNLVIYLKEVMGANGGSAAIQVMLFEGTCYLTPVLGAWLADSTWGRYITILVFSVIYLLGTSLLAISALVPGLAPPPWKYPSRLQSGIFYASLYIIALGTGGIKPNVSAFGADQFDDTDPQDRKEKKSFFNWFYLVINLGSLLAVTVVVYVQETVGWGIGFAIPGAAMLVAIIMFMCGSSRYVHVAPTESPITRVFNVIKAAIRNNWAARRNTPSSRQLYANGPQDDANRDARHALMQGMRPTGSSSANGVEASGVSSSSQSLTWLDSAIAPSYALGDRRHSFSESQVEEVKLVLRMLPVFLATILYWTIYIQMSTFFVEQGQQMDRQIGSGFVFPAASLALFNTVSIIVLIPLYDKGLMPLLRKMGKRISLLQRIGWGLVAAVFAMLVAAAVEWYRLQLFREGHVVPPEDGSAANHHHHHHQGLAVVSMSVFWQVPQYLIIGLSEVLTSIGQLEFFYDQAPDVMRSCSMALQLLSVCIGSYLSGALVWAVGRITANPDGTGGWLTKDLNEGRLDLFFLFMAALMVVGLLFFLAVAVRYQYKEVVHQRKPTKVATYKRLPISIRNRPVPPAAWAMRPRPVEGIPEGMEQYSRSVTFVAPSPTLPAPFR